MALTLESLVADLKASLFDSATVFASEGDTHFQRFLQQALPDLQFKRPVTRLGMVTLTEGEASYSLAAYPDFAAYKSNLWADPAKCPKPWEPAYPGAMPRVFEQDVGGVWHLVFEPAPTLLHIAAMGAGFKFWYFAQHTLGDANATTVREADRGLLLLRAQAEAMRELAIRNAGKPVQMRDGLSGMPRNSTPVALHQALMRAFAEAR